MKMKIGMGMKILGASHSGHDVAYAILENGIPTLHCELERVLRVKEPPGDPFEFFLEDYDNDSEIIITATCAPFATDEDPSKIIVERHGDKLRKIAERCPDNELSVKIYGHHECHAANSFFSSNFKDAMLVCIDGGGFDLYPMSSSDGMSYLVPHYVTFTIWEGRDNDIRLAYSNGSYIQEHPIVSDSEMDQYAMLFVGTKFDPRFNIGTLWSECTRSIFGLSNGYPKGHQAGSVMAMAALGNADIFYNKFYEYITGNKKHEGNRQFCESLKSSVDLTEQTKFDIAAALQRVTENHYQSLLTPVIDKAISNGIKNLCLSGGVVLNSVMTGKMLEWWPQLDDIYVCPVPYDAGLAIGAAQLVWHRELGNPRVNWEDNCTPYLGKKYSKYDVLGAINSARDSIVAEHGVSIDDVVDKLIGQNIISVFGGGSESGRRALGNRSILADPRSEKMKDMINEKVKHRQWYRPFAPSILRDDVAEWFERDKNSPYMSFVMKFKEEKAKEVPAVVHFDNTARLQTVTRKDNPWFHSLLNSFKAKTGVPILLNTSFNDREPIVETPRDAVSCFMGTNIDYLYFYDEKILVRKAISE